MPPVNPFDDGEDINVSRLPNNVNNKATTTTTARTSTRNDVNAGNNNSLYTKSANDTNPFSDAEVPLRNSSGASGSTSTNPFGSAGTVTASANLPPRMNLNSNNPFGAASNSNTNPFEVANNSTTMNKPFPSRASFATSSSSTSTNPFSSNTTRDVRNAKGVINPTNPFATSATTDEIKSVGRTSNTNPFEADTPNINTRRPSTTNPFDIPSANNHNHNISKSGVGPSTVTTTTASIHTMSSSSTNNNNPFDEGIKATDDIFGGTAGAAASAFSLSHLKRPGALTNLFRGKTTSTTTSDTMPGEYLKSSSVEDELGITNDDSTNVTKNQHNHQHRRAQSGTATLPSTAMGWFKRSGTNDMPQLLEDRTSSNLISATTITASTNPFSAAPSSGGLSTADTSITSSSQHHLNVTAAPLHFFNEATKNFNNATAAGGITATTTATTTITKEKKKKNKKKKDSSLHNSKKTMLKTANNKASIWPYDNYQSTPSSTTHDALSKLRTYSESERDFVGDGYPLTKTGVETSRQTHGTLNGESITEDNKNNNSNKLLYERPSSLPSIAEAAQELSLVEFEAKAEERAIAIVSMWLHDSGLIDDLLVTGTQGYASIRRRAQQAVGHSTNAPQLPPSSSMSLGSPTAADDATTASTKTSSEGIEVGMHGFPIMASDAFKMEKEVEWMRNRVQRELTLVNARLNEGVAASGAEVQELVNAVAATRGDLGRLRNMVTYITQSVNNQDEFILKNCPRLRSIMNARRNLFTCFRDLEFFDQMPTTCNRLREELHSGEWTTDEWKTIRSVSMEHVELEILLVEAEAGMKARLKGEQGEMSKFVGDHSNYSSDDTHFRAMERNTYEAVDRFLSAHVTNVWELGDEIKMRIMSGLGSSFDLAKNNPADLVALVEAVEVYERAAEHYKALLYDDAKGKEVSKLRFTDMRASALKQLYEHFQTRGLDLFRTIQMRAADIAEEGDTKNMMFSAVLQAATELVSEVELVKNVLVPCFPPHWSVDVLWSSCVAYVCSNEILQQIGGPQGLGIQDLSVTQLLDLVAWVECFREHIEDSFPQIAKLRSSKKAYFASMPKLFAEGKKKEIDMESAADSLAWANNTLWDVHSIAQNEFLQHTRMQIDDWLDNVYGASRTHEETGDGKLTTSLSEDLFSLIGIQLRTIREHLSPSSEALVSAVCLIFSNMRMKQIHGRDHFLQDLESSCAAANDFTRMSELCEEALAELLHECKFDDDVRETLEASANEVLAIYSADAVYAAQSTHAFIFEPIADAISNELFGVEWEKNLTHNELALTLVRTIEDFMGDLDQFLDNFLLVKVVDALVSATVVFYVRCLLVRSENHTSAKVGFFQDTQMALDRMTGDVRVMTEFFEGLVPRMPSLKRVIEKEFEFFTALYELISIAAGLSDSDASNFIIVVHKLLMGNIDLTKHFVGDIWHLVNPQEEKGIWELIDSMEEQLEAIAPKSEAAIRKAMDRQQVSGLRLDRMMADLYLQSKRKLPIKSSTFEKMVNTLKMDWTSHEKGEGRRQDLSRSLLS